MIKILWFVTLDRGQLLLSFLCSEVALALIPEGLGFLECTVIVFILYVVEICIRYPQNSVFAERNQLT